MPYKFNIAKQGYAPDEVEQYVNALEKKLKEFKDKENIIQNAIISAQTAADAIVKNAQMEAYNTQQTVLKQLDEVKGSLNMLRMKAESFKSDYSELLIKYLIPLNSSDFLKFEEEFQKISDEISQLGNSKMKSEARYNKNQSNTIGANVTDAEIAELTL